MTTDPPKKQDQPVAPKEKAAPPPAITSKAPEPTRAVAQANPTTTLSEGDKTILMNEWKEIRETLRYFGNKRFAQLTVFIAASGFILNAIYGKDNPMPALWGGLLGALLALIFLVHEWTSVRYFKRFVKRGGEIEKRVQLVQMMSSRPRGDLGTWSTYFLYVILLVAWLAIAYCDLLDTKPPRFHPQWAKDLWQTVTGQPPPLPTPQPPLPPTPSP